MDFIVPDNYIDLGKINESNYNFEEEADALQKALDAAKKENDIQQYIKRTGKWFIPASILKDYDFGHHSAYLVSEQPLGAEYKVDYMLLGHNSIGHQIVLVEFEDVNVDYTIRSSNILTDYVRY